MIKVLKFLVKLVLILWCLIIILGIIGTVLLALFS